MTKPEPKYVEATLRWCNARRKEIGKRPLKKLPKGIKREPNSCPCGKATEMEVYPDTAYRVSNYGWDEFRIPRSVNTFIRNFDSGNLPQYELKEKK